MLRYMSELCTRAGAQIQFRDGGVAEQSGVRAQALIWGIRVTALEHIAERGREGGHVVGGLWATMLFCPDLTLSSQH